MTQESQAFAHRGEIQHLIPTGSVDLNSGDVVVMARNIDPISRAVLGAESRLRPLANAYSSQWMVGVVDTDFNTKAIGSTLYATPTSDQAVPVIKRGVVRLAITQTSGQAGDLVVYSSGASGVQLFTLNNFRRDVAVGRIWKDFSGATANDPQQVELIEKPISEKDIYFWMGNGVMSGCKLKKHSVNGQASSQINIGATGDENNIMLKNKYQRIIRKTDFSIGSINPGGASALRFYWLAAHVSTTGAGNIFTVETCTGPFSAFASWTNSGISLGMMIPITWNSNHVPIGLALGWSVTQVSIGSDRLFNIGAAGQVPWGNTFNDHETWYL